MAPDLPKHADDWTDEVPLADNLHDHTDDPTDNATEDVSAGQDVTDVTDNPAGYSSECHVCGSLLLLLDVPGRDICERCRLEAKKNSS